MFHMNEDLLVKKRIFLPPPPFFLVERGKEEEETELVVSGRCVKRESKPDFRLICWIFSILFPLIPLFFWAWYGRRVPNPFLS